MGFGRYVLHRLLLVVPTLFGVTLISFTLVYVLPGNPALVKAGSLATPEHVAARAHRGRRAAAAPPHRTLRDRRGPHRSRDRAAFRPPPPHAPRAHAGLRRHGSAHPDGARDHARDPRIRLRESRLGGGAAAPACHLWRRPPQRAHPRHHAARRHLRLPDGGQRRG